MGTCTLKTQVIVWNCCTDFGEPVCVIKYGIWILESS